MTSTQWNEFFNAYFGSNGFGDADQLAEKYNLTKIVQLDETLCREVKKAIADSNSWMKFRLADPHLSEKKLLNIALKLVKDWISETSTIKKFFELTKIASTDRQFGYPLLSEIIKKRDPVLVRVLLKQLMIDIDTDSDEEVLTLAKKRISPVC